jgi:hypothetical protein
MLTIPPGEPVLVVAILAAAKSKAASYVCQHEGVSGWHVGESLPATAAYFRVSAQRIYIRQGDQEVYFGRVEQGKVIPEGNVKNVQVLPRRRRR